MNKTNDTKGEKMPVSKIADTKPAESKVQLLTASGPHTLPSGSVLIMSATPGFRRAGITHERVKIWSRRELSEEQINALKREPELTLIEVI